MTDLKDLGIDFGFVQPLMELWQDEKIREKLQETGRLYYTNSFLSIDLYVYLYWGLGILGFMFIMGWLLGLDIFSGLGIPFGQTSGSGYGMAYRSDDEIIAELQQQVSQLQDGGLAADGYGSYGDGGYGYDAAASQPNVDAVGYSS